MLSSTQMQKVQCVGSFSLSFLDDLMRHYVTLSEMNMVVVYAVLRAIFHPKLHFSLFFSLSFLLDPYPSNPSYSLAHFSGWIEWILCGILSDEAHLFPVSFFEAAFYQNFLVSTATIYIHYDMMRMKTTIF